MKVEKMFEPITINKTVVKNRFVVSPMVVCMVEEDGLATERWIAYLEAKAKGGWGLIMTEDYEIAPHVGGFPALPGLYDDSQIESHRELTERVHRYGSTILAQIYHAGRETTSGIRKGTRPVGPSAIKDPTQPEIPRELSVGEIHQIVEQFGEAAVRAKKAGFDGVEVHGAHGYLINAFVSGFSNRRTDEYGGSIEGRARLAVEIVRKVREKTGEDFIICYRMSTQEYVPGGLSLAETKILAQLVEEAGADVIHCSQGVYTSSQAVIASGSTPPAHYIENTMAIRDSVNVPVIAVGRVTDPLLAEMIVAEGKADLVTMARASLADPDLPNKTLAGQRDDIIRCIGCNQGCDGRNTKWLPVRCLVNPLQGMEYKYDFSPAAQKKTVWVAGGGVSGCEAAMVAAKRGHDVVLFEKEDRLGGQWLAASTPIAKSEFTTFVIWQKKQLKDLGVKVHLNTPLTRQMVLAAKQGASEFGPAPDTVVVAAGSDPHLIPFPGVETADTPTAIDVLMGRRPVGKKILVVGAGDAGCETADHVAVHGASEVTLIDILPDILPDMPGAPKKHLLGRLKEYGVRICLETGIEEIHGKAVRLKSRLMNPETGEPVEQVWHLQGIDTIIMATGMRANSELAESLQGFPGLEVVNVGDSRKVKPGYDNIQEAFDLAYQI